ncbi:MAG: hypothetical protein H7321_06625 [Bacteroidia bacterium]|nr:hypothetical protein [Bacteroidia bacterium]
MLKKIFKLNLIFFFLLLIVIGSNSCSSNKKSDNDVIVEMRMVDSLDLGIDQIKDWLDRAPLHEIQERIDVIETNLAFIQQNYKGTLNDEMKGILNDYKALGENYKIQEKEYVPIVTKTEESFTRLQALKQSATEKDYPKKEFLRYYYQERIEVYKIHKKASIILQNFIDTDLHYERREKEVEDFCETIKPK